uniref:Keratinocyte associated protein 3 n=1 Tax=Falco tinnunculus TaxID=100819 RepID=A0A8C4U4U0_FALTI
GGGAGRPCPGAGPHGGRGGGGHGGRAAGAGGAGAADGRGAGAHRAGPRQPGAGRHRARLGPAARRRRPPLRHPRVRGGQRGVRGLRAAGESGRERGGGWGGQPVRALSADLSPQSIAVGIVAILVSHNLSQAALHWTLLSMSLLNCLLSTVCSAGLVLAIALTVHSRGTHLIRGCNSSALPADARAAIVTNDCPFNTTRIYDTALALWFPSMVLAATEAVLSGRCGLVALILRGIGPCARSYAKEQLAQPSTVKEGPPHEMQQQLLARLADSCA